MLRRCAVFVLLFVTIQGIYDPSDEVPEKPTKTVHFHHNYSKVNVQRPVLNAHSYGQRPVTAHQEIERLTQNGDLVRIKRNRTKIEIYSKCPKGATGQFVFELSCNQYLNCWKGRGFVQNCAPGTLFNPKTLECDYAEKVQCVTGPRQSMLLHHYEKLTEETQPGCPERFSGIIPHYTDCSKFINCDRGKENVMDCAPGTLFDVNSNNCDFPHKAQCVNQQGGYSEQGRDANAYGQHYSANGGSSQGSGTYDQNAYDGQGGRYRQTQRVWSNSRGSSSDQNQQSSNLETSSSSGYQGPRYKPVHNVGSGYQSNSDHFDQNLESYGQHLESSSTNTGGRQGYRPVHNIRTTYQSPFSGSGQAQYNKNLDSYDQNGESSFTNGQSTLGHKGHGYKPVSNYQSSSTDYEQGTNDQNLVSYDQNVESSSPNWLRTPNRQYRPVHNVTTTYQGQGQYDQNLESSSDTFNTDNHRAPRYRPIHNVDTASDTNYDQSHNSESFSSYSRGHQINAYRPSHNVKTAYQASPNDDQDLQLSRLNQGIYSQNQQLASSSNVYDQNHQTQSPKCPEGGAGLYAHPYDCSKFLNCANGITYIQDCAPGTLFNPSLKVCDFPYNVPCSNKEDNSSTIDSYGQQQHTGGINLPSSSTRRPAGSYASNHPQTNIDRHQQTVYDQQNRNYQHRPAQNWQEGGDNAPYSSTRRPVGSYASSRPQTNIDRHGQTVYDLQNRNYQHRPVQNWQEGGDNTPYSSTRRPAGSYASNRPQTNIDRHDQTVYEQQNRNYPHRPVQNGQEGGDTRRPESYHTSNRPQANEGNVYDQQNKNYDHRPSRQWNRVDGGSQTGGSSYLQNQQSPDREQGVIEQKTLYDGHQQGWIPVEADAPLSSTSKPVGFYVTKPPQNFHTPKPDDYARTYETPEVDYVYEYDDDIIVDTQPASSNKKPQSIVCRGGQYTCPNNHCITNLALCDGFHDCVDGGDESNCDLDKFAATRNNKLAVAEKKKIANTTTVACAKYCLDEISFQCRAFNYRKHDGVCYLLDRNVGLSGALIIYQIFDYYEMMSKTINCTNLFNCPNNKCVPYSKLCDGQNDCGDRADEKHCSAHVLGYNIRLSGSPNKNEGRVVVTALGKTGFVCDDNFGMRDAEVVCRELGFELGALEVKGNSYYAKEMGNNTFYLMDDVGCLGNESSLRDCDFNGWGVHNCMGQEVVGVVCKTSEEKCKEGFWQCDNEQECIPVGFLCDGVYDCTDSSDEEDSHCNAPIQLRLANGSTHLEGRVEVKYLDTWGTICDDDFNEDAAKVVCQYFGFQGSASVRKNAYFGPGKGAIWLDQVFCQGNESSLQDCVHWDWGEHNCDHSEDVGVVCSESAYVEGTERRRKEPVVEPPRVEPLQLLPERCGFRKDSIFTRDDEVHFRVVKGSEAKNGDYPWQASIRVKGKSKPTHWCGAVVISQRFVLTAAHCLQGFGKSAYIVVAGDYRVDEDEGSEQVVLIEDFYLHEDFRKGQKMNNDIALVKLKGNGFTITEDVQPICLPDTTTAYLNDMNCTISGFGSTKSGKAFYSHVLRAGWIPLQSRDICKMPHIYGTSITEGMICAGFLDEGVDACDGDSGGPLACLHEGVFTLFGITSWGQHCGYANKPGVYVKVGYYREWIEEKMRKYA